MSTLQQSPPTSTATQHTVHHAKRRTSSTSHHGHGHGLHRNSSGGDLHRSNSRSGALGLHAMTTMATAPKMNREESKSGSEDGVAGHKDKTKTKVKRKNSMVGGLKRNMSSKSVNLHRNHSEVHLAKVSGTKSSRNKSTTSGNGKEPGNESAEWSSGEEVSDSQEAQTELTVGGGNEEVAGDDDEDDEEDGLEMRKGKRASARSSRSVSRERTRQQLPQALSKQQPEGQQQQQQPVSGTGVAPGGTQMSRTDSGTKAAGLPESLEAVLARPQPPPRTESDKSASAQAQLHRSVSRGFDLGANDLAEVKETEISSPAVPSGSGTQTPAEEYKRQQLLQETKEQRAGNAGSNANAPSVDSGLGVMPERPTSGMLYNQRRTPSNPNSPTPPSDTPSGPSASHAPRTASGLSSHIRQDSASSTIAPSVTGQTVPSRHLRTRNSHTSLRSLQSLRAPPHPLSSPSRTRVSSLRNQNAVAPPVMNMEIASGVWSGGGSPADNNGNVASLANRQGGGGGGMTRSMSSRSGFGLPEHQGKGMGVGESSENTRPNAAGSLRKASFSSVHSMRGQATTSTSNSAGGSGNGSGAGNMGPPTSYRANSMSGGTGRLSAQEAAQAAARLAGPPSSSGGPGIFVRNNSSSNLSYLGHINEGREVETAHLVSRFLPPTVGLSGGSGGTHSRQRSSRSGRGREEDWSFPESPFAAAHASLVMSMREERNLMRPVLNRADSRGFGVSRDNAQRDRQPLGLSPLELSIQRCLAQRAVAVRTSGLAGLGIEN